MIFFLRQYPTFSSKARQGTSARVDIPASLRIVLARHLHPPLTACVVMPQQQRPVQVRPAPAANNAWNHVARPPAVAAVNEPPQLPPPPPEDVNNRPAPDDAVGDHEVVAVAAAAVVEEDKSVVCCFPGGCSRAEDAILLSDPEDAVRVLCNNDACQAGQWMHHSCFQEWEQGVLGYLRSSGRARSWSEKQRLQNLWTKKGYDLAFKACDCKCGKGHLRKDLDYVAPPRKVDDRRQKRPKKKMEKPSAVIRQQSVNGGSTAQPSMQHLADGGRSQLRVRTSSLCSTGSSPPTSSDGTPPLTPGGPAAAKAGRFEFFADAEQAAAGNIFWRRTDLSAFNALPRHQQNPYRIKVEDEGPHGNDETRSFLLTTLSAQKVTVVSCIVCRADLPIYDKYPLVDGTFFLSALAYGGQRASVAVTAPTGDRRRVHLNAVCMRCLDGTQATLRCRGCKAPWSGGATLVIGTMYAYDIFAATPCCSARLACKSCRRPVLDPGSAFQFFSEYSHMIRCPHCHLEDFHFIKPLQEAFCTANSSSAVRQY